MINKPISAMTSYKRLDTANRTAVAVHQCRQHFTCGFHGSDRDCIKYKQAE